jgi:hypothetical protein
MRLASVGCGEACGIDCAAQFGPQDGAGRVLERQLGALWNEDVGIGAFGDRGPGLSADPDVVRPRAEARRQAGASVRPRMSQRVRAGRRAGL